MSDKQSPEYLNHLRHSAAHLLAAAVLELYPDTKLTIGPAIDNGFYYDFDFTKPLSDEDFPVIEAKMATIAPTWSEFKGEQVTEEEALKRVGDNPFKKELINEIVNRGESLTFYTSGSFSDLCRGGHVEHPDQELKHFKLLSTAGAYWRGNEKNPMLTRIYGTIWPSQQELNDDLQRREEAKKRDHRVIGQDLELFTFSPLVGKGLPLWLPKGATIRRELERFVTDEELKRDYLHVYTPDIALLDLYKTSGHYPYYKDSMYAPIDIDDETFMLRPMTCPHHFEVYKAKPRSYRELPMRIGELAKLYRYEKSGELSGLMRVRTFCLADAHIVAKPDQANSVIHEVLELIEYVSQVFSLELGKDYHYRLSLGDRADDKKYFKDDAAWDYAEEVLRQVLKERNSPFVEAEQEAAFYGPKIDVQMKNVHGKEDTAFTVQYDFVMPGRFKLEYTDADGQIKQPIVIHRSSIGAIERIMGFLIERYGGAFPVWLAPTQAVIIPVSDKHNDYAQDIFQQLKAANIRVELDQRNETMGSKIRQAQTQKVPYMVIVGDKEVADQTLTVRIRGQQDQEVLQLQPFLDRIAQQISQKS